MNNRYRFIKRISCLAAFAIILVVMGAATEAYGESRKPIFTKLEEIEEYGEGIFEAFTTGVQQRQNNLDAGISIKVDKPSVLPGDKLTYMVSVENRGDAIEGAAIALAISGNVLPVEGANQEWVYVSMEDQQGEVYAHGVDFIDGGSSESPTTIAVEFLVEVDKNLPSNVHELNATASLAVEDQEDYLATDSVIVNVLSPDANLPKTGGPLEAEILVMVFALGIFLAGAVLKLIAKRRKQIQ